MLLEPASYLTLTICTEVSYEKKIIWNFGYTYMWIMKNVTKSYKS
jgi:hypothetical protein